MISNKVNYSKNLIAGLMLVVLAFYSMDAYSQKHALEFRNNQYNKNKKDTIIIDFQNNIFRDSDKLGLIKQFESLEASHQEELINKYIKVATKVNDSILFDIIKTRIKESLEGYDFCIIDSSISLEHPSKNVHYLSLIQIEMEEVNYFDTIFGSNPSQMFAKEITGINLNLWLSYKQASSSSSSNNNDNNKEIIFYHSNGFYPYMYGDLVVSNGELYAQYDLEETNPNHFYNLAYKNSGLVAQYFFNFLMNKYVYQNTEDEDKYYYSIDPSTKTIYYDDEPFDMFEVL